MIIKQLAVNTLLCFTGLIGVLTNKTNLLLLLISLEIMFLGLNLNFIIFSCIINDLLGQLIALFILSIIGAESAIGLAILITYYRVRGKIQTLQTVAIRN
jgi:NADH-quinone oxidoreductase subunit K